MKKLNEELITNIGDALIQMGDKLKRTARSNNMSEFFIARGIIKTCSDMLWDEMEVIKE